MLRHIASPAAGAAWCSQRSLTTSSATPQSSSSRSAPSIDLRNACQHSSSARLKRSTLLGNTTSSTPTEYFHSQLDIRVSTDDPTIRSNILTAHSPKERRLLPPSRLRDTLVSLGNSLVSSLNSLGAGDGSILMIPRSA